MTSPIQGYKIESFVPDHLATDHDFHVALRRRLEDLMQMQGFDQETRVEVRVLSQGELEDCPLRPGFQIVEAAVVVSEYDVEVPMPEDTESSEMAQASSQIEHHEPMGVQTPVESVESQVTIASTQTCTTCGHPVVPHNYRHPITTMGSPR